jgi:hypothetical protein
MFNLGALCPSKSGLMNKRIVKHLVKHLPFRILITCREAYRASKAGLVRRQIVKPIATYPRRNLLPNFISVNPPKDGYYLVDHPPT